MIWDDGIGGPPRDWHKVAQEASDEFDRQYTWNCLYAPDHADDGQHDGPDPDGGARKISFPPLDYPWICEVVQELLL